MHAVAGLLEVALTRGVGERFGLGEGPPAGGEQVAHQRQLDLIRRAGILGKVLHPGALEELGGASTVRRLAGDGQPEPIQAAIAIEEAEERATYGLPRLREGLSGRRRRGEARAPQIANLACDVEIEVAP